MVRGLRRRYHDRFSEYFSPEALEALQQQIDGRFSGIGLIGAEVKRGCGSTGLHGLARRSRRGSRPANVIVSVDGDIDRRRKPSTEATEKIKGPEGTEVTVGVLDAEPTEGPAS